MNLKFHLPLLFFFLSITLSAQEMVPIAFDLKSPIDVNLDAAGNLWITESGTGANDGQIVRLNADQSLDTIITALPSLFDFTSNELQGALSAHHLEDGRIIVMQGAGIDTASASVLVFHLDDYEAKGAALTVADSRRIIRLGTWSASQGYAESNPYSFAFDDAGNYIIADAAGNAVFKYDLTTESFSVVADLPSFPNPLPFGPPFIEPVPTKILAHPDGGWLLGTLTGFPFADGAAKIYHLQADGSLEVYAEGLTLITDMAFDPRDGQLLVQQFAQFGPVDTSLSFLFGSAQTIKVDENGSLDTLLRGYGPSPGMAIAADGSLYMTHLFLGQLIRTELNVSANRNLPVITHSLELFPNPSSGQFQTTIELKGASSLNFQLYDQGGHLIRSGTLGYFLSGSNQLSFDLSDIPLSTGVYYLYIRAKEAHFTTNLLITKN